MTRNALENAIQEARRFLYKAGEVVFSPQMKAGEGFLPSKETGAVKRASLDLTRALAEMRKP